MTIPGANRREQLRVGQANSDTVLTVAGGSVRISKYRQFKRLYPVGPTPIPYPTTTKVLYPRALLYSS